MPKRLRPHLDDANRLRNALYELHLSQRGGARFLGIAERTMRYYCAGVLPVPRVIWLALVGIGTGCLNGDADPRSTRQRASAEPLDRGGGSEPGPSPL